MATGRRKIFLLLMVLALSLQSRCDDTTVRVEEDLSESESKDPTKVEIIKQIKRVNEDGSYTFGYEAEDGTFKIESRDVLGNVKGTFGFVDADGEIKRVSYSSTNNNESTTLTSNDKEKASSSSSSSSSSVIQHIPRSNRTATLVSSTRKPLAYVSTTPSSTSVVQSIPRRRVLTSSNTSAQSTTTTTTPRSSYKNVVKATDFDITTIKTSTAEMPRAIPTKPAGHYIRSTFAPLSETHRYIEGQLIRPTQPATVTTYPAELYPRRLIATSNPYLDDRLPTIKPLSEESVITDSPRANLLRRQLSQEKVLESRQAHPSPKPDDRQPVLQIQQPTHFNSEGRQHLMSIEEIPEGTKIINFSALSRRLPDNAQIVNFDSREHMLHLQQSLGEDATDVYSASLTTGTPRPLFTTTERPFPFTVVNQAARLVAPVKKYHNLQKAMKGGQETSTDSTTLDNNYAQPSPGPVIQVASGDNGALPLPLLRMRHPFHGGTILIPVNQAPVGSYVVEEQHDDVPQSNYAQFLPVPGQQYLRESNIQRPQQLAAKVIPVPYLVPKRRPIPLDYHQSIQIPNRFVPKSVHIPLAGQPMELQDEIDNIKPPVSTRDFQKLLNRLIFRQSQLQEISRLEHVRMVQKAQEAYVPTGGATPVSVFVRTRPDAKSNSGPVQFVEQPANGRSGHFVTQAVPVQKLLDPQPDYEISSYPYSSESYARAPRYRSGRRSARLNPAHSKINSNENESYLPPEVREMLLLRMLQLAINPNLPLPPSESDEMTTAIRQSQKEAVRNVEILGEEEPDDDAKPAARNKRFQQVSEFQY